MAESQKAGTSSVKPKEKTSELDLDFGKDFMSSWKDDGMDFDFGSPAKGKKKTFDFGKLDMDFNLDGDFNKLSSSFKLDMPDLDISSPLKKAGKEMEQSKQVSSTESSRKKKDNFAFSFDFKEFDDLNFETKLEKVSTRSNMSKSKEVSSSQSGSGDAGAHLAKDNVPMEDDISSKLQEERGVDPSEMDTEVDNVETADIRDEDGSSKSLTEDGFIQVPANSEENYTIGTDAPEKTDSVMILEKEQDKQQLENVSPAEAYHPALVHDSPGQSKADNTSTQNTPSDVEDEVLIPANVNPRQNGERNVSEKLIGPESNNGNSRDESVPSESAKNSPTENGDMSNLTAVNDVTNATDSSELTHSEFEHHSIPNDSKKLLQGPMTNERNKNSTSKLLVASAKSGTVKNDSVPEIEKGSSVIQSKYFKRPNEVESQSQQAPITQKKLISNDTKRIGTTQVNLINEKVTDPKATQSGICLAGISRPQPRKLGGEPVHTGNAEGLKGVNINRDKDFPANTIQRGSKLMGTSRTNDQDLSKEGLALIRNGKNAEDPIALSSPLHPSISHGQANKSTSKSSINFRLPPSSTTSTKDTTKLFSENNVISPDQAGRRTPELPALKSLRTTGGNLVPVNSALLKGIKSTRNSEQSMEVQENMVSKNTHFTETKKQASPTLTLKRKTFGDSNVDKLNFTPSKRLSASPSENRYASAPSDRVVNEKAFNHDNVVGDNTRNTLNDCQTPTVDIPLDNHFTELETTLSLETDSNVEKAEALSKELEHICNMLKKKHEEAKEILVRAIVNNNNLLMLNHPMHLEKIRMVQKLAALLISK